MRDDSDVTNFDEDRAPICADCGVTALPAESDHPFDPRFVCENPDCDAFGEVVLQGDFDG
jgi:hypothetical protein